MLPSPEFPKVQTQPIGYAPILRHYVERCRLVEIIDQHVPLDPRRTELTHGQACIAMMTGILHHVFQLYNIRKFATDSDILQLGHFKPGMGKTPLAWQWGQSRSSTSIILLPGYLP